MILSFEALIGWRRAAIRASKIAPGADARVVLTNGCFDILHVGHVDLLERARKLGDFLVVAVNSDFSVRKLKGPTRPLNTENDRARVVAALAAVDAVVIFNQPRVTTLLAIIQPAVWVKGGDYTIDSLNQDEVKMAQAHGTEIVILPLLPGKSTTSLIQKAHESTGPH